MGNTQNLSKRSITKRWDISPNWKALTSSRNISLKGIMTAITHTEAEYGDIKGCLCCGFTHAAHFDQRPGFHKAP